jgi:hypothetical protein
MRASRIVKECSDRTLRPDEGPLARVLRCSCSRSLRSPGGSPAAVSAHEPVPRRDAGATLRRGKRGRRSSSTPIAAARARHRCFPRPERRAGHSADELLDVHLMTVSADFVRMRAIGLLSACLVPATGGSRGDFSRPAARCSRRSSWRRALISSFSPSAPLASTRPRALSVLASFASRASRAGCLRARRGSPCARVACLHNGAFGATTAPPRTCFRRDPERAMVADRNAARSGRARSRVSLSRRRCKGAER